MKVYTLVGVWERDVRWPRRRFRSEVRWHYETQPPGVIIENGLNYVQFYGRTADKVEKKALKWLNTAEDYQYRVANRWQKIK